MNSRDRASNKKTTKIPDRDICICSNSFANFVQVVKLFLKVLYSGSTKRCFTVFESSKNVFAAKQDQKLFQERLNYFFVEMGSVNYWRSRIMEREFKDDSSISLHEVFRF